MDKDEVKKSLKANLEPHKATYWLMGLVLGVAVILLALEWTTETAKMDESMVIVPVLAEEEIDVTQREPTPPPPPPPPVPETPEVLEIKDEEVETRLEIQEFNDTEGQTVAVAPPPPPAPPTQVQQAPVDEIFVVVEVNPEFPGGPTALMQWLNSNMRYPVIAQENGIQGRVITQFVVERDGSITDVQIVRGVDPSLDREAVRVVSAMPRWTPGQQRGTPVRVRFTLPVQFRLQQ